MERYRLEVGATHGVKPGYIVGAIANEIGLESEFIGKVQVMDDHSTVDLPEGMPKSVFKELKQVHICGQRLNASLLAPAAEESSPAAGNRRHGGKRPPRQKAGVRHTKGGRRSPQRKKR